MIKFNSLLSVKLQIKASPINIYQVLAKKQQRWFHLFLKWLVSTGSYFDFPLYRFIKILPVSRPIFHLLQTGKIEQYQRWFFFQVSQNRYLFWVHYTGVLWSWEVRGVLFKNGIFQKLVYGKCIHHYLDRCNITVESQLV